MGGGEEQFPFLSAMKMGRDEGINPRPALAAVGDGAADGDLVHSAEGGPEDGTWKLGVGEGADQGAVLELGGHICVDVLGGEAGGAEVSLSVLWMGRGEEGEIPAESEGGDQLLGIEVALQGVLPRVDGEGRTGKRDPERIHVGWDTRYGTKG